MFDKFPTDRRTLLASGLLSLTACTKNKKSAIVGADHVSGHRLWNQNFPPSEPGPKVGTLIIGAGVSGLAAAYTLKKAGSNDYHILDLASEPGGNARAGHTGDLSFPWGAHYLPQPGANNHDLMAFLTDCGVITGRDGRGQAVYNDDYLCHDVEERLYYQGAWHEGLIPWKSLEPSTIKEIRAFFAYTDVMRASIGRDNKRGFQIPLSLSSIDPHYAELDRMTFANFVRGQGWTSPFLGWYLNYCCRDDYGTDWEETSAWAGLHYFAARSGENNKVLTWPEGNNWLVKQLIKGSEAKFTGGEIVHKLSPEKGSGLWAIESWSETLGANRRWLASDVILAVPRFAGSRLLPELPYSKDMMSYAPWMVANCEVDSMPLSNGTPLAWDNVPYGSASLGYVVSNHQSIERYASKGILTSYWPLTGGSSDYLRAVSGLRSTEDWVRLVKADFEMMHPGYSDSIQNVSIWLWGHGMIQPKPGYITGEYRQALNEAPFPRLALAHTDMSGISIFEEAFAQGLKAARQVLGVTPWT
ncbi:MAG: NAD(P)-binding protein [Chitinophagaceae bacterium]|nr:NAD(P)-binding protein [Oligoflexus sp.]